MFNFGLNAEQQELKSSLRRYLDDQCSSSAIREILENPDHFAAKTWRDLADQGLLGIIIPEAYGGSGLGYVDVVAVLENLGRVTLPAPYLESIVVADLIARAGTEEQKVRYLPKIGTGDLVATYAVEEAGGFWDADAIQATATPTGGRYTLRGTKLWVPYANIADLIVCAIRTSASSNGEGGISLVALEPRRLGLQIRILDGLDDSYQLCEINLDGLLVSRSEIIGPADGGWSTWCATRRVANLLTSAELVGNMEKCLEMVVAYSKERSQFGKLIGSYQAIKHRCADLLTDMEAVRGSVYYAAWAMEQQTQDMDIAVSSAKAYASDAAIQSAEMSLQSFGAIGFTWEHDIHFYLKRAKRLEMTSGDASYHREQIAARWL